MTTNVSTGPTDTSGRSLRTVCGLALINLGLVALQALSAGLLMSGYRPAVRAHAVVALALQFGALTQAVTAVVLWRRGRAPAWVVGNSVLLLVIAFLQSGFGYRRSFWLHVPIGVAIFGGLTRQVTRLVSAR